MPEIELLREYRKKAKSFYPLPCLFGRDIIEIPGVLFVYNALFKKLLFCFALSYPDGLRGLVLGSYRIIILGGGFFGSVIFCFVGNAPYQTYA